MGRRITAIDLDKFYFVTVKFDNISPYGIHESITAMTGKKLLNVIDNIKEALGLNLNIDIPIIDDHYILDFESDFLELVIINEIPKETYDIFVKHANSVNSSTEIGYGFNYINDVINMKLMENK